MPPAYGAVAEFLQARFGGPIREESATVTVGTAAVNVAGRDPERMALIFVNLGASELFLAPTPQVSITHGIRLSAAGGTVAMSVTEDGTLPAAEWTAIGINPGVSLFRLTIRRETQTGEVKGGA